MKKYILLLPLILVILSSCEDVVTIDPGVQYTDLFAIEANISTIDEPSVFLTKGISVTSDLQPIGISDALITISDDAQPPNIITLDEDTNRKGYYIVPSNIDYYGYAGREYTLNIEAQGVTLEAKDFLAPVEHIDSIRIRPSENGDKQFLAIAAFSQETPGLGNYYKWNIYINDTLLNKTENIAIASDELVDGNYVGDLEVFVDYHDPKIETERKLKLHDTVYVKQNSISAVAYNFYLAMMNQRFGGFLFSVPPANAKGNFTSSDGKVVLGMFTAQDVSRSNSVVIDTTIENMINKK